MSGCVYNYIYKSSVDINIMLESGSIDYIKGVYVDRLQEANNQVTVYTTNKAGTSETRAFDRVFLAAGAVNSTKIVLTSKDIFNEKVLLKSTVGFVAPMFRFKRSSLGAFSVNTQPGLFFDFKVPGLSNHWVHSQVSTPNELVLAKLKVDIKKTGLVNSIKKWLVSHLVVANCNLHSNHSNGYELHIEKGVDGGVNLISNRELGPEARKAIKQSIWQFFKLGLKFGCYTLLPFIQDSLKSGGYHVGGSLPMKLKPEKETDTNIMGNPKGWNLINVVDSSIFPSLPGTTIGLLAMANATRIAMEVEL